MKHVHILFTLILFLSGCNLSEEAPVASTGPEVDIMNVVVVGLNFDTNGEIVLEGGISIPTPIHTEVFDVNWNVGFEKVLREADNQTNYLYVVWEDEADDVRMAVFDIQKPFRIDFEEEDWVRSIERRGDGTIVAAIENRGVKGSPPVIDSIGLPKTIKCDGRRYDVPILFHDEDGDAHRITWQLLYSKKETTLYTDSKEFYIEGDEQINGATYEDFIEWHIPGDEVEIRVFIEDKTEQSGYKDFDFKCSN